jgi:hypothetical protein
MNRTPAPFGCTLLLLAAIALLPSFRGFAAAPTALPAALEVTGWQLQEISKVPTAGGKLSRPGESTSGWYRATVPGTVLTTLVNNGVYPEPLYGENNRPDKIPDSLCRTSYWYRAELDVPTAYEGRRVWLNFDGINYTARVWVNGTEAGAIHGALARGVFDVTDLVRPGERAAFAVLIEPPPHPATPHEQTIAAGTGPNGGEFSKDGPTFICTQGWDWIPGIRDRDMGIWQKVWLSASGGVRLEEPLVYSHVPLPKTDVADVFVEATLRNVTSQTAEVKLAGGFEGAAFSTTVTLAPHASQRVKFSPANTPRLHVERPRLWWPNGYGAPNLYELKIEATVAGSVSDTYAAHFGIREIRYEVPGSPNLTISVNGVPVMCRGGDWGMDEAMKRIPRERLEAQIRFHQLARCNMIRNWVGQSTGEDFYDLCDRYGILVWDEFFQPNPSDSGRTQPNDGSEDVHDVALYLANVREKVLRFRNHPSIALWCGRNEGDPAPGAVAEGLERIMRELEPVRLYHPNSADGRGVRSGGPYSWRPPAEYFLPPQRHRDPENTKRDPAGLEPFKTEIGTVSIPTLEAIQAMMPEKDWDTINDDWAEHDLCRGAQAGDQFVTMLAERYGAWKGLAGFAREAQLATYEAHQAMFEGRYARLFSPCTGVLAWMSNPAQPSLVWQFYSYDLEPISALYAVRKASETLHIQLNRNDDRVAVVNHTPEAVSELTARAWVIGLDGRTLFDKRAHVAVPPSAATDPELPVPNTFEAPHFVKLELRDPAGQLLSENIYWRGSAAEPDNLRALDTLPKIQLATTATRHDRDGKCLITVTVANRGSTVALLAHVQLRKAKSGARVLPVFYDENYLSLLPGESRRIEVEAAVSSLGGEIPVIAIDGWNIQPALVKL